MIRIAAIADLHCRQACPTRYRDWYRQLNDEADVFILAGDMTHFGKPEEARALAAELSVIRIPVLAVLGNHDVHSNRSEEVKAVFRDAGVRVLDDGPCRLEVNGSSVGFAGSKGFCGGFGTTCLTPFGETALKAFINETLVEAESLERSLGELDTKYRVVVLHYAPVRETERGIPVRNVALPVLRKYYVTYELGG